MGSKSCTDRVRLYNLRKDKELDAAYVMEDWGVRPDQVVDFQAIVGDPVDNVPGVPLFGPKLASQLLQRFDGASQPGHQRHLVLHRKINLAQAMVDVIATQSTHQLLQQIMLFQRALRADQGCKISVLVGCCLQLLNRTGGRG